MIVRRPPTRLLCALLIVVGAFGLAACGDEDHEGGRASIEGAGYSADGSRYIVRIDSAWVGPSDDDSWAIDSIQYLWMEADGVQWRGENFRTVIDGQTGADGAALRFNADRTRVAGTFSIPARAEGGYLRIRLRSKVVTRECSSPITCERWTYFSWSPSLAVPPRAAPEPPRVKVIASGAPRGEDRVLLDARLSHGVGALSYEWAPACYDGTGATGAALVEGQTLVPYDFEGACTVTVTDAATGLTATGSADIAEVALFHSGAFAFDGSSAVQITGPFGGGRDAGGACINFDGGAPVDHYVLLRGGGVGAKRAEVSLPTLAPGLHRITATFWAAGENATCAKRTLAAVGVLQVASAIYEVADDGGARQLRAPYVARSTLRLASGTVVREGKVSATGVRSGSITRGRFTWRAPRTGGGARRPAVLGRLARGTYASRVGQLLYGPAGGAKVSLIGVTTVLLRGSGGTLACLRIDGLPSSTTVTLIGGSGMAELTGPAMTYRLPSAGTTRPAVRPTAIRGKLTAAARKARPLPRACRNLKRYLR